MAVAVTRHRKEVRTGLHMNILFFVMSVVVLLVMGVSMWKDTHPEWLVYQEKFTSLERSVLLAKQEDLLRQINHPTYLEDYKKAKAAYLASKAKSDAATSALEGTEADLEEKEVRLNAGKDEEGGSAPAPATPAAAPAKGGAPTSSKSEMDDLDKEFAGGSAKSGSTPPAKVAPAAAPAKASGKELDDLDKEFASGDKSKPAPGSAPAKPGKASPAPASASKNELDDLDKEFSSSSSKPAPATPAPASGKQTTAPAKGESSEMADLDKEFKDTGTAKASGSQGAATAATAAKPEDTLTFEEADFKVDVPAAQARLEAAQRDLITAERTFNKEKIGLPEDATLKRDISQGKWTEAQQSLEVAKTSVDLEEAKSVVKTAAQVAKWAADGQALNELVSRKQLEAQPADRIKQLKDSDTNLKAHVASLQKDLRLVQGRLSRNQTNGAAVEQNYADRLGSIDRCTTCHKAVEQPGFEKQAEPFRTHSAEVLKNHPIEKFGCVSCHGGYGNALNKAEAHGEDIGKGHPLLIGEQIQSSCGKCHGETRQLSGEATYLAGAELFKTSGCLGCHKVEPTQPAATASAAQRVIQGAPTKAGPDLDRVGEKVHPDWLTGWLQNPQSHSLDARMPNLGLSKDQAGAIATFLLTQRGGTAAGSSAPPSMNEQRLAQGRRLVENLGCFGCHTIRGEGSSIGPELTNLGGKVNPEWLYGWIANPKQYFPNSRMPVFNLTKDQSVLIGDYLLSVKTGSKNPHDFMPNLQDARAKDLGQKLIAERGCAGCHDMKGFDRISAPELTHVGDKTADVLEFGNAKGVKRDLYSYMLTKITDPRSFDTDKFKGKMPKFGLEKSDAKTIAVYLMSLSGQELPPEYTKDLQEQNSPLLAGRRIFAQHDCAACHRISGVGGKVGPELTREGEMVRPGWMFEFLKQPIRIRWWADARMPNYHLTDQEATTLTEYFMSLSNQPAPYEYTPPDQKVFPLAQLGAKYFSDLKCQSCHPLAGKQGVAGGDSKKLGPDLGMAPARLKKDWIFRFLKDPQGFSPGTQMPSFGKPDDQYLAIVDFLMKQATKSP